MKRIAAVLSLVVLSSLCSLGMAEPPLGSKRTVLDEYVAKEDSTYSWKLEKTLSNGPLTTAVIQLKTQTWLTEKEVNRPVWEHWLVVTMPETVITDRVFLLVGGGSHESNMPNGPDAIAATISKATGSIVAEIKNIPNQPLIFHQDGQPRTEDDLIGYAWSQYLETGDATWLPRLPMVKSVVRAMDCITEFVASEAGGKRSVKKFVVGGASKRGWTTWMTGAADDRVEAVVPIVIDVVNVEKSLRHHAEAYGFWSEAIGNYYQHKLLQRFDHPRMQSLYETVDPFYYKGRLKMPKYIVNGSGDQFFLPDSSLFYYDQLPGEKLIRYVPNADHGLKNTDAVQSIATFYHLVSTGKPRPEYAWTFEEDGSIRATSTSKPSLVLLWQANNSKARDFRLTTIGPAFVSTELQAGSDGAYVAPKPLDQPGWTASFIELTYDVGAAFPLKVTTAVRVTPNELPFKGIDLTQVRYEPELAKEIDLTGK